MDKMLWFAHGWVLDILKGKPWHLATRPLQSGVQINTTLLIDLPLPLRLSYQNEI